jgi:hypothetical protein
MDDSISHLGRVKAEVVAKRKVAAKRWIS